MAQALHRGSWILSNDNRSASQRFHIVIRFDPSATRPAEHPFLCYIARDGDKIGCAWFTKDGFLLGLLREHMGVRINENEPGALAVLAGRPFLVLRGAQSGIEYEATLWPEMKRGIVDIDVASVLQRATEVRAGTQPQDLMLRIDGLSAIVTLAGEGGGIAYDRVELNSPGPGGRGPDGRQRAHGARS